MTQKIAVMAPTGTDFSEFQLAGHQGTIERTVPGRLRKRCRPSEAEFYSRIASKQLKSSIDEWIPIIYEIRSSGADSVIEMEDLTASFNNPSILDLKIGTTSVDPTEIEVKRLKMLRKDLNSTTGSLGLRIAGLRRVVRSKAPEALENINAEEPFIERRGREWGRSIRQEEMQAALQRFFTIDNIHINLRVCALVEQKLIDLIKFQENQHEFKVISSSLLILYDCATSELPNICLKMIDFAHVEYFDDQERSNKRVDEEYLFGLRVLLRLVKDIQRSALQL